MQTATPNAIFDELHAQLSQAVLACRAKAEKKPVHTLRTTTRRLEALLHKAAEDHSRSQDLKQSVRKALRQLKKIRRLAGPVRDLDVHHKLVKEAFAASPTRAREAYLHQQHQLETYLERRRGSAAEELQAGLERREVRLERALQRVSQVLASLPSSTNDRLTTAQSWVERSAAHLGGLTAQNLHDFRKQTKLARYLSEMQPSSAAARAFTKNLLAIQDSIGEWHDLDLLHQEAKAVCGKHAELTTHFRNSADRALQKALKKAQAPPLA